MSIREIIAPLDGPFVIRDVRGPDGILTRTVIQISLEEAKEKQAQRRAREREAFVRLLRETR